MTTISTITFKLGIEELPNDTFRVIEITIPAIDRAPNGDLVQRINPLHQMLGQDAKGHILRDDRARQTVIISMEEFMDEVGHKMVGKQIVIKSPFAKNVTDLTTYFGRFLAHPACSNEVCESYYQFILDRVPESVAIYHEIINKGIWPETIFINPHWLGIPDSSYFR